MLPGRPLWLVLCCLLPNAMYAGAPCPYANMSFFYTIHSMCFKNQTLVVFICQKQLLKKDLNHQGRPQVRKTRTRRLALGHSHDEPVILRPWRCTFPVGSSPCIPRILCSVQSRGAATLICKRCTCSPHHHLAPRRSRPVHLSRCTRRGHSMPCSCRIGRSQHRAPPLCRTRAPGFDKKMGGYCAP